MGRPTKIYPDQTFEKCMRERGFTVRCMWQAPGPKNTQVAWVELLACYGEGGAFTLATVFTYADVNGPTGWEVMTPPTGGNSILDTLAAVEAQMFANRPTAA